MTYFSNKPTLALQRSAFYFFKALAFALLFISNLSAQQPGPVIDWQKSYGVRITSWAETNDGYLLGYLGSGKGGRDFGLIKIDKAGTTQWQKVIGGPNNDDLSKILRVSDGFLLAGSTVSAIGGDKTTTGRGYEDFWVVKTKDDGTKVWDKTYGSTNKDIFADIVPTSDGGFIVGGTSNSPKGWEKSEDPRMVAGDYLNNDYWVLKANSNGQKVWDKTYGGAKTPSGSSGYAQLQEDFLNSITSTNDGGFLLAGHSNSSIGFDKTQNSHQLSSTFDANFDFWVIRITSSGFKVWDKTFGTGHNEQICDVVSSPDGTFVLAGQKYSYINQYYYDDVSIYRFNGSGTELFQSTENGTFLFISAFNGGFGIARNVYSPTGDFISTYTWDGTRRYQKDITRAGISLFEFNSLNELFLGDARYNTGKDFIPALIKYKAEPANPAPYLFLTLQTGNLTIGAADYQDLVVDAVPNYFASSVTKVEFYIDGVKKGEDNSYPYTFEYNLRPVGKHLVSAKAYTASGQIISSATTPWTFFDEGFQAENNSTQLIPPYEEFENELDGGSTIRLWTVGDKVTYWLDAPDYAYGKYIIKVRVRSGYHTPTVSNPTSYWADGYTFLVNGQPVVFKGDPSSISEKLKAYGGSYWSTMVSPPITMDPSGNGISIIANKTWGGVDYIELQSPVVKVEAETSFAIEEAGAKPVTKQSNPRLSAGSSVGLPDSGDKISIPFKSNAGQYVIRTTLRSGFYTSTTTDYSAYFPSGYSYWVDGTSAVFKTTQVNWNENPAYGGSYWGQMSSDTLTLTAGTHQLAIRGNKNYAGVDYFELLPVGSAASARIALPEIVQRLKSTAFPNPFNSGINIQLKDNVEEATITLLDSYGKLIHRETKQFNNNKSALLDVASKGLKPGIYIIKIRTLKGEETLRVLKK